MEQDWHLRISYIFGNRAVISGKRYTAWVLIANLCIFDQMNKAPNQWGRCSYVCGSGARRPNEQQLSAGRAPCCSHWSACCIFGPCVKATPGESLLTKEIGWGLLKSWF